MLLAQQPAILVFFSFHVQNGPSDISHENFEVFSFYSSFERACLIMLKLSFSVILFSKTVSNWPSLL